MTQVLRVRHVDYTEDLIPVVVQLPSVGCFTTSADFPEFLGGRHIKYGDNTFAPTVAHGYVCCDSFEDLSGGTYVEAACWPYGPGPGILETIGIYAFDTDTCCSARDLQTTLTYDGISKWVGTMSGFRDGALDLELTCSGGVFTLTYSGCTTSKGTEGNFFVGTITCQTPLIVAFGPIILGHCCDCRETSALGTGTSLVNPVTDEPGQVTFYIATNCEPLTFVRHIGYAGTTPLVANEQPCTWRNADECGACESMKCPVVATITGGDCMEYSYGLDYIAAGSQWYWTGSICGYPATITLECGSSGGTGTGTDGLDEYVTLTLNITCGTTNTGSGSITIHKDDLQDLDTTISVIMDDPNSGIDNCTGANTGTSTGTIGCVYTYVAMSFQWILTTDNCTLAGGSCLPCPATPTSPPGAPADGETYEESCPYTAVPCYEGTISVRIMRF